MTKTERDQKAKAVYEAVSVHSMRRDWPWQRAKDLPSAKIARYGKLWSTGASAAEVVKLAFDFVDGRIQEPEIVARIESAMRNKRVGT